MMAKVFWCLAPVFVFLQSCGDGADVPEELLVEVENQPTLGMTWEQYRDQARAAANGGDYYLVEGDLFFATEDALRVHYDELTAERSKLAVFTRISDGFEPLFSFNDALDIKYCVSNSFSNKSTVVEDMATATGAWEDVINVRFRYISGEDGSCNQNNDDVDFAVMPTTISTTLAGCAASKMMWGENGCPVGSPSSPNYVRGVLLMQYGLFPRPSPYQNQTPLGTMKHELGHMLGFAHEHPWASSQAPCNEPVTWQEYELTARQLTDYDQASVMHYQQCNGVVGGDMDITELDGEGAREVYSMPASWYVATVLQP